MFDKKDEMEHGNTDRSGEGGSSGFSRVLPLMLNTAIIALSQGSALKMAGKL